MAHNPLDPAQQTDADRRFIAARESGYKGWLDEDGNIPTKENTDPRLWEAMQTPFRQPGDPRNPR